MKRIITILILLLSSVVYSQRIALVKLNDKYGFIKANGDWLVEPIYDDAESFSDGMAEVMLEGKWGFINKDGEVKIKLKYHKVHPFDNDLALVNNNDDWYYINKNGSKLTYYNSDPLYPYHHGVAVVRDENGLMGAINTYGELIVNPEYEFLGKFEGGYSKFKQNNLWGLVDINGVEIIKAQYRKVSFPSQGIIVATKTNGECGVISNGVFSKVEGAVFIEPFINGQSLTFAQNNEGKIGYINRLGKWVIRPKYKKARRFSEGLAAVSENGFLWGFINSNGESIIRQRFIDAKYFNEEFALVRDGSSRKWGVINKQGKMIVPAEYEIYSMYFKFSKAKVVGFDQGVTRVGKDGNWGYINKNHELLNGMWFQSAENFVDINE